MWSEVVGLNASGTTSVKLQSFWFLIGTSCVLVFSCMVLEPYSSHQRMLITGKETLR